MEITRGTIRKAFCGYKPIGELEFRHFSVLVPLVKDREGRLSLLYEVRASKLDRQPGEICFPGGLIEKGESTLQCALRETYEEVGIASEAVEVISELDPIISTSGSLIHGYLGIVDDEAFANIDPSPEEVSEIFTVPIQLLLKTEPEMYMNGLKQEPDKAFPYEMVCGTDSYPWRSGKSPVPVYEVEDRIIWGLTGRITRQFIHILKQLGDDL